MAIPSAVVGEPSIAVQLRAGTEKASSPLNRFKEARPSLLTGKVSATGRPQTVVLTKMQPVIGVREDKVD